MTGRDDPFLPRRGEALLSFASQAYGLPCPPRRGAFALCGVHPFARRGSASRARALALLALAFLGGLARAQSPDVRLSADLALTFNAGTAGPATGRLYTPLGRYSTVRIAALLESGLNVVVTQRLQRFAGDADDELLDEYYVEDPGIWRVGKQVLPFGPQATNRPLSGVVGLLRESMRAARADTNLVFEGVPVSAAVFDGGVGRPRGAVARLGPRAYGVSAMVGEHIGVSGSALAVFRGAEGSPGPGAGWRQALGFDAAYRVGQDVFRVEGLALRNAEGRDARGRRSGDRTILDLSFTRELRRRDFVLVGLARDFDRDRNVLRFTANLRVRDNLAFEPTVVSEQGTPTRLALGVRARF